MTPQKEIAQVEIHDKENYFNSPEGRRVSFGSEVRSDSKSPQKRNTLPVSPVPKSLLGRRPEGGGPAFGFGVPSSVAPEAEASK